jgi:hypothetical protein
MLNELFDAIEYVRWMYRSVRDEDQFLHRAVCVGMVASYHCGATRRLNQVVMYSVCLSDSVDALVCCVCTGGCIRYIGSRRSRGDSDVCVVIFSHGSLPTVSLRRAFRLGVDL